MVMRPIYWGPGCKPLSHNGAIEAQNKYNRKISAVCLAVERNYNVLKQIWTSNDFSRSL